MSNPLRRYYRGRTLAAMRGMPAGIGRQYHFDYQGTTQALSDSQGVTTERFKSDAWGVQVMRSGNTVNRHWSIANWGYYRDLDTVKDYVRARHASAPQARWLSPDPIDKRGPNAYGQQRPTTLIDPSGLYSWRLGAFSYVPVIPQPPQGCGAATWCHLTPCNPVHTTGCNTNIPALYGLAITAGWPRFQQIVRYYWNSSRNKPPFSVDGWMRALIAKSGADQRLCDSALSDAALAVERLPCDGQVRRIYNHGAIGEPKIEFWEDRDLYNAIGGHRAWARAFASCRCGSDRFIYTMTFYYGITDISLGDGAEIHIPGTNLSVWWPNSNPECCHSCGVFCDFNVRGWTTFTVAWVSTGRRPSRCAGN